MSSVVSTTAPQRKCKHYFLEIMNFIVLILSIMLIVWISIDTFKRVDFLRSHSYMTFQFWVCVVFIIDFFCGNALFRRQMAIFPTPHSVPAAIHTLPQHNQSDEYTIGKRRNILRAFHSACPRSVGSLNSYQLSINQCCDEYIHVLSVDNDFGRLFLLLNILSARSRSQY